MKRYPNILQDILNTNGVQRISVEKGRIVVLAWGWAYPIPLGPETTLREAIDTAFDIFCNGGDWPEAWGADRRPERT